MCCILGTRISPQRVSQLIICDGNLASAFLFLFNDTLVLVKGWNYNSPAPPPPSPVSAEWRYLLALLFPRLQAEVRPV